MQGQSSRLDLFAPDLDQVVGDALQATVGRQAFLALLRTRQQQEGLHQVAHLLGGLGHPLQLATGARAEAGFFGQQFA